MTLWLVIKPYWLTFWLSMLPITELRGSIPWALSVFQTAPLMTFIVAVLGNIIPAIILLWGLQYVDKFFVKSNNIVSKAYAWVITRTRRKTQKKILQYGYLALLLFVAVPLPGTGAWTGSIAAWLFGLPKKPSLLIICLGVIMAGIVVTLITTGTIKFFNIL